MSRLTKKGRRPARRGLVLAAALLVSAFAQPVMAGDPAAHPMRFDRISITDGLSQNNVLSIMQDSSGLMWFGTESGLNRFDGYDFTVYRRDRGNTDALYNDYINDIAESGGAMWIATNGGGLARLDRRSGDVDVHLHDADDESTPSSNFIRRVLASPDGSLWAGTLGAGLDHYDTENGRIANFRFGDETTALHDPDEVYAMHRDSSDALWIGTNGGLIRFDTESGDYTRFEHRADDETSLSGHRVRAILEDSRGRLWVGTYGAGLNLFDPDSGTFERFRHDPAAPGSLSGDRVTSIFEDSAKRLWVGTDAGLNLVLPDSKGFASFRHQAYDSSSLGDDGITTLFEDRGGILWVGTRSGISKWHPRSWSFGYRKAQQLSQAGDAAPNVTSFVVDGEGVLWVGTFGDGLHAIDRARGTTTTYRHDPQDATSLSDDRVMSLGIDSQGAVWVGTMRGGLNRLDAESGEFRTFRHDPHDPRSIGADGIMAVFTDAAGNVWAGTYGGGANRYDATRGDFTRFLPADGDPLSISSSKVRAFAGDPSGRIWMGTDAGGLNLFDPATESFHTFRHDPADASTLAGDTVYALAVSDDGTVWVGTQGGGIDRVIGSADAPDSIRFSNLSQKHGLTSDVIYGLEVDDTGTVWASTDFGISRFDPETGSIRNLHRKDGLQGEEFHSGAHYRSANGELFFGGPEGYNAFHPDATQTAGIAPLVVLTGVFKGNDPIRSGIPEDDASQIEFSHRDDNVSFEFAALDYTASARNRYRYKLEGFDREWIDLGNRRRVTYTDLDDGHYTLRVQAANSDGVWNDAGLAVPVRVSPAPWDTWWAYLGYCAVAAQLGLLLWFGHQRKIRREEEYSKRLESEVRERTEKLAESNRKLKALNHTLQETSLSDPLTGLRNRRFVFEEVSRDLDVVRRKFEQQDEGLSDSDISDLVFMMIDLDSFKPINDTYGHAAGDQMLLEVRDVLLGTCRKSDFVIRWGGDEFVVIAKQAKPGEAEALAERIRRQIAEHSFQLEDGQVVRSTCSIGFAAYPLFRGQAEAADLDQILSLADNLMYEAKRHRNAWAGMLSPSEAATSFEFDHDSIDPTSMLFRAKRAGRLVTHDGYSDATRTDLVAAG